jgi:hypothetical protein
MMNSRAIMLVVVVHIETGNSKRKLISKSSSALAVRLINGPEYINTFASVENLWDGI